MSHVVLGCDPGANHVALVALRPVDGARFAVVLAERVPNTLSELDGWLVEAKRRFGVLALGCEWAAGGGYTPARVPMLLRTQEAAARVEALAWKLGIPRYAMAAQTWRRAVLGPMKRPKLAPGEARVKAPWDKLVAARLPALLVDMPSGHGHDANHLRDACGVGIHAAKLAGLPVLAPPGDDDKPARRRAAKRAQSALFG